jgi:ubiquinone/menaquinone biosynthesis C-methylase UbiE
MRKLEPKNSKAYTAHFNTFYSLFSGIYDFLVKHYHPWQDVVGRVIPHIRGFRVLEVSFGTGWLLTQYASRFETYGIDLNEKMIRVTSRNLRTVGITAYLQRANVEALPYRNETFDTIVNTAAFSGYPSADRAMCEFRRVLKPGGRLVLIDIGYPKDGNWLGRALARFTEVSGDILRDMGPVFTRNGFEYHEEVIGGFGSMYLYIAQKTGIQDDIKIN